MFRKSRLLILAAMLTTGCVAGQRQSMTCEIDELFAQLPRGVSTIFQQSKSSSRESPLFKQFENPEFLNRVIKEMQRVNQKAEGQGMHDEGEPPYPYAYTLLSSEISLQCIYEVRDSVADLLVAQYAVKYDPTEFQGGIVRIGFERKTGRIRALPAYYMDLLRTQLGELLSGGEDGSQLQRNREIAMILALTYDRGPILVLSTVDDIETAFRIGAEFRRFVDTCTGSCVLPLYVCLSALDQDLVYPTSNSARDQQDIREKDELRVIFRNALLGKNAHEESQDGVSNRLFCIRMDNGELFEANTKLNDQGEATIIGQRLLAVTPVSIYQVEN
ncbi:MAG: hypothetical protein IT585_04570 [candidate division Zixibacteria bacterium]|nr:hypothetical protein [candidate division Zixibacteria bacterium]